CCKERFFSFKVDFIYLPKTTFLRYPDECFSIVCPIPTTGIAVIPTCFNIYPCGIFLRVNGTTLSGIGICQYDFAVILFAVELLEDDGLSIQNPFHAWNIMLRFVAFYFYFSGVLLFKVVQPDTCCRGIHAYFWIFHRNRKRVETISVIYHQEVSGTSCILFPKCYFLSVRRPPKTVFCSELFFVSPIKGAVNDAV